MQVEFYPTTIEAGVAQTDIECYVFASLEPNHLYYKTTALGVCLGKTYCDKQFKGKVSLPVMHGFIVRTNPLDVADKVREFNKAGFGSPFPNVMVKCVIPAGSKYYFGTPHGDKLFSALCTEKIKVLAWKKEGEHKWHTEQEFEEDMDSYRYGMVSE